MRSKDSKVESPDDEVLVVTQTTHDIKEEEKGKILDTEKNIKFKHKEGEDKVRLDNGDKTENDDQTFGLRHLSKDDLLKLLGTMEGEIQAREDVILLLRSALLSQPQQLESRYGSAGPTKPLLALQRDSMLNSNQTRYDNVYEKPIAELDRLQDKHKEAYQCMLKQLLLTEKSHQRTVQELETEKREHVDYMNKSDDFTNLLEQERERLKQLLKQEKAYQIRKEKEFSKRIQRTSGELVKLKSFALMLVDERELHLEKIDKQSHKIKDLLQKLQDKEQNLSQSERKAREDSQKILDLEVELEKRTSRFAQEQEEMAAKLYNQQSQHQLMSKKQVELSHKVKELEETNEVLKKSTEELQDLRDKIRKGECGNLNLIAEVETLRNRIVEMENKDVEITKVENTCNELKKKLNAMETHNNDLKLVIKKLQLAQLEKLEISFSIDRTEYTQLQAALEKEKSLTKNLTDELVAVKIRMKELESSELKLEKDEMDLKEDLMKLKSVTVIMVNEHKNIADRSRSEEKKKEELNKLYKAEQEKVMEVTEKLIEESKKRLKLKSEMELKLAALVKERDEIKCKLANAEEKVKELNFKVCLMLQRSDNMKEEEKESVKEVNELQSISNAYGKDENKDLREKIHELMNTEDEFSQLQVDYSMLQQRFLEKKDKKNSISNEVLHLTKELEVTKHYSPTLRVCTKGNQVIDIPMTATGVQTDSFENRTVNGDTPAVFIKTSVQEESRLMCSLQQRSLKKPAQRPTVRELYPPAVSDFSVRKSWIPSIKKKDCSSSEMFVDNSEEAGASEINLSHKYEGPLHAKVIPCLKNSEEALQISRSSSEDLLKRTAATPSHEIQKPHITIIPANAVTLAEKNKEPKNSERARSPMTTATISRVKSPESTQPLPMDRSLSPVSIMSNSSSALSASSPEPLDMITGRAIFRVTPEKRMVPTPIKKCNSPANNLTTENSKVHLHIGSQFKKAAENNGSVAMVKSIPVTIASKEFSAGTVLRSPHNVTASKSTLNKVTSNITTTQVTKAPVRPALSVQPVPDVPSTLSGFTRIPMSRGMKTGKGVLGALGITKGVKMETNADLPGHAH